ncbi:MAG: LysR family transcriptional regulator [Myxococcota bacterium]|nr:LysR family transcriptional regulator [Myxococcota bacterium]
MDLDSLRCFDAVATTLNFRAAAARVHLSPAAFSGRIQRLEEELGTRLLARTTRKVALSDAGRALVPRVRDVLARIEQLRHGVDEPDRLPFELVVGTRYELGLSWLCPALTPLARAHPERTIHLYNGDTADLRARVERGELDAVVGSMRFTSAALAHAVLHDEAYVFVGSRHVRLRAPRDAEQLTLFDVTRDLPLFRYFLDAVPGGEAWNFRRVELLGGIAAVRRRLLDCEQGVAVLPTYFIRADLQAGRLRKLLPRIELRSDSFRLVWRAGHPRESALVELASELRRLPLR